MFDKPLHTPVPPVAPPVGKPATNNAALELCRQLYLELSSHGYYPALTGGLLYKYGERKDIDVVIFRNRQSHDHFEMIEIEHLLVNVGFSDFEYYGFVTKAKWYGHVVDLFNPETKLEFDESMYGG